MLAVNPDPVEPKLRGDPRDLDRRNTDGGSEEDLARLDSLTEAGRLVVRGGAVVLHIDIAFGRSGNAVGGGVGGGMLLDGEEGRHC